MIDHRTPAVTWWAIVVSDVGSTIGMAVIAIATAGLLWWRGRRSDALLVAVVAVGAGVLVRVGKATIGRERPPEGFRLVVESNESFPSGHALASAAILGVVVVVLVPLLHATWAKATLIAAATLFAVAIGVSRPYLGVHWATDVLGGWVIGLTWLYFCVTVRSVWRHRRGIADAVDDDRPATDHPSSAAGKRPADPPR
jgi:membrane-associated phospholipid phosphatase